MASSKAGSKKKGKKAQAETPPGGGGFRSLLRGCATLLLVLLILYVTMVLFTRTDGFRSYLEGQLEKKFGLLADVGSSRMGWSGDLTLETIVPASTDEPGGGRLQVKRVVVHTDCLGIWRNNLAATFSDLTVEDCELTFQQTTEGRWEPVVFQGLSEWLNRWCKIDVIDLGPEGQGERGDASESGKQGTSLQSLDLDSFRLAVSGGAIRWEDAEGELLASVHDVEAYVTPLHLPTRDATHIHVRASSVQLSPWELIRDLDVELLKSVDTYRVLRLDAERQTVGHAPSSPRPFRESVVEAGLVEDVAPVPPEPMLRESRLPSVRRVPGTELENLIRDELHQALDD